MESLDQQVQRLNIAFGGKLNLEKIAEAAQLVSEDKVAQVLNSLAEKGTDVNDPTAWVTHAMRRAAGGGASTFSSSEDGDKQLRKKIGWLNKTEGGGFENSILYDKIVEASGGLPYDRVMQVLQMVEGKKDEVRDPTAWICSALRKAGGGGAPAAAWAPAQPQAMMGGGATIFDDKVRKRINWLNGTGGFGGALIPEKVSQAAAGVATEEVLRILKDLEEKRANVNDPLAYVTSALRKSGGGAAGYAGAPAGAAAGGNTALSTPQGTWMPAEAASEDQKLRKRIGWLNSHGGFGGALLYTNIFEAAGGLEFSEVFNALKNLEEKRNAGGEIRDPTAWVCRALRRAAEKGHHTQVPVTTFAAAPQQHMAPAAAQNAPVPMDMDQDTYSKLHKKTKWLNGTGGFNGSLLFDKIVEAAAGLDSSTSMAIFKELEEKKDTVKNPTSYVTAAMRKARTGVMPPVKKTIIKNKH